MQAVAFTTSIQSQLRSPYLNEIEITKAYKKVRTISIKNFAKLTPTFKEIVDLVPEPANEDSDVERITKFGSSYFQKMISMENNNFFINLINFTLNIKI